MKSVVMIGAGFEGIGAARARAPGRCSVSIAKPEPVLERWRHRIRISGFQQPEALFS